jgi:hypothetical protein
MTTFTGRLNQLEAQLQSFIEGKIARLSPIHGNQDNMARRLVASMRAGTISTGDGVLLAPDQFTVFVHPSQADSFCNDPQLLEDLSKLLREIGKEAGLYFGSHPEIKISPNEDVAINRIDIISKISERALGNTTDLRGKDMGNTNSYPANAFLIINGTEVFTLDHPVINIGRRNTNHLTIEDPRVSRQHAQIRAAYGRYEIFDLASTGGTFVNKKRITNCLLRPGDVISLAGISLIYGQERASVSKTKKFSPTDPSDSPSKQ